MPFFGPTVPPFDPMHLSGGSCVQRLNLSKDVGGVTTEWRACVNRSCTGEASTTEWKNAAVHVVDAQKSPDGKDGSC